MESVWWLFFLVCAVVLCTVMAGATDAPLEQGRINQLSVRKSEFVCSQCVDIAKSGEELCCELAKLNNQQSSMLILHHCHVPRLTYYSPMI